MPDLCLHLSPVEPNCWVQNKHSNESCEDIPDCTTVTVFLKQKFLKKIL